MVEILSPRPPTPPRPPSRTEDSPGIIQTPRDTSAPSSVNGSAGNSTDRPSKRVNFSPWTNYIKPPPFSHPSFKALPPSNECKPAKSILKTPQTSSPVSPLDVAPCTPESFVMLLESITQQLAGESMSSRQDAYMHFLGVLKAYEGLPEEQEVSAKIGKITQFIQRDVSRDLVNGGPFDTNLVIHALKLSITFIWHREISTRLPEDFRVFLVDHSINCLQDAKVPKSVLVYYMHVLAAQNFGPKVMTNMRLTRLMTTLYDITNRVNGSAIVLQRLNIYQRVLNQSKSTFVANSELWMVHLISGLLHHVKDTRQRAISLGFHIAMALGPNPTLSRTVRDVFNRSLGKGRKMVSEICERLYRMMTPVDSGISVPQIWGIVILLLRDKKLRVDQWEYFKDWLFILQKCFNCSEPAIKSQAILGWNRFVFAVSPHEMTTRPILRSLSRPILMQFERKRQEKPWTKPSQLAMCSYYNLLYYGFRPSASYLQFDLVWEEFIGIPSSNVFASVPLLSDRFSRALTSLLWSPQAKVWSENKFNESSKLEPEELLSLDCKWIRSRVDSVLGVFESLFKSSVWDDNAVDKSNIATAWVSLSTALSHASSKEITPSTEAMHAVASVIGLLRRLWDNGPSSLHAVGDRCMDKFLDRFRFLSTTMISMFGSISFTEKLLLKTADETFQPASTPQHRHLPANASLRSPILHLLRLISEAPGISEPTPSYTRLVEGALQVACDGKSSRGSRLELFRQCTDLYMSEEVPHFGQYRLCQAAWKVAATFTADCLLSSPIESVRERDGSISRDYENTEKILTPGLGCPGVFLEWNRLLDSFFCILRTEKGNRAIATVIERLAERLLLYQAKDICLSSATLFNHSMAIPRFHEDELNAKRDDSNNKSTENEPLSFHNSMVKLADKILGDTYNGFSPSSCVGIAKFFESLTSFLGTGALSFRVRLLENLQQPLSLWINDETYKLNAECHTESIACQSLSFAVLGILRDIKPCDGSFLRKFETAICAGLKSTNGSIAKEFRDTLFPTFDSQGPSVYPKLIIRALRRTMPSESSRELQVLDAYFQEPQADPGGKTPIEAQEKQDIPLYEREFQRGSSLDDPFVSVGPEFPNCDSSPVAKANQQPTTVSVDISSPKHQSVNMQAQAVSTNSSSLFFHKARTQVSGTNRPHEDAKREEMPKTFEGYPSASSKTPRKSAPGLFSPYFHKYNKSGSTAEAPGTPTFPAGKADNDESFLGSSPTPASRNLVCGTRFEIPITIASPDRDPPSSPPDPPEVAPQDSVAYGKVEPPTTSGTTLDENTAAKTVGNKGVLNRQTSSSPQEICKTKGVKDTKEQELPNKNGAAQIVESLAMHPCPPPYELPSSDNIRENFDCRANSPCDDLEVQVASQLEQDMEHAADIDGSPTNSLSSPRTAKKRKRLEQKSHGSSKRKRHRSSRLTRISSDDPQEPKITQASRRSLTGFSESQGTPASTPLSESGKKRRSSSRLSFSNEEGPHAEDKARTENQDQRKPTENLSAQSNGCPRWNDAANETLQSEIPESAAQAPIDTEMKEAGLRIEREAPQDDFQMKEAKITPTNQLVSQACQTEYPMEIIAAADHSSINKHAVSEACQTENPTEIGSTGTGVFTSLRQVLNDIKMTSLSRSELREADDLLFDLRVEMYEASRRACG